MRPPVLRAYLGADEIAVDNFAGGGGASSGVSWALGRSPDIAINHDPQAIAMHAANHPETKHFVENVWAVDPVKAAAGRPVGLAWFSPTCTHFSKAKGTPLSAESVKIRGLAWVAVRWAAAVRPRIICLTPGSWPDMSGALVKLASLVTDLTSARREELMSVTWNPVAREVALICLARAERALHEAVAP